MKTLKIAQLIIQGTGLIINVVIKLADIAKVVKEGGEVNE